MGVPKSHRLGFPRLWSPIILWTDLGSRCGLWQSCSSCQELCNIMSHAPCIQVNRVDFRLFVVKSQIGNLTLGLSFSHNLCFKCPNEQWEPILDIYVPKDFQWYKERHKPLSFDPWNCSLKFWKSTRTPSPKVGVALGVWGFIPSYSLIFFYTPRSMWCDSWASSLARTLATSLPWLPGFFLARNLVTPLPWLQAPKLGLRQNYPSKLGIHWWRCITPIHKPIKCSSNKSCIIYRKTRWTLVTIL